MISSIYVAGKLSGPVHASVVMIGLLEKKFTINRCFAYEVQVDPKIGAENIYSFNDQQILKSDAFVAFCDHELTNVGMGVMIAHEAGKRIVLLHSHSSEPDRMLLEFAAKVGYPVLRYSESDIMSDIAERVVAQLSK